MFSIRFRLFTKMTWRFLIHLKKNYSNLKLHMNESINTRISKEKMRLLNRNLKIRGIRNLEKTLILELDTTKTNNIKRVVN